MKKNERYEEFKERLIKDILLALPEDYLDGVVEVTSIQKVNQTIDKLVVRKSKDSVIAPSITINTLYDDFMNGKVSYPRALKYIVKLIDDAYKNVPSELTNQTFDLTDWKEKVVVNVINYDQNVNLLQNIPHMKFLDLAIIYRYIVNVSDDGTMGTIIVNNNIMERYGIKEDELMKYALYNTRKNCPFVISSMDDMLKSMLGTEFEFEMPFALPSEPQLYVITNEQKLNGANAILFEDVLRSVSDFVEDDLYIIPSSIHEVIALAASSISVNDLAAMVHEVNFEHVDISERLSNQSYFYNRRTRTTIIATHADGRLE